MLPSLAVSDRFRPPSGLAASVDDIELEFARLEMLGDLKLFVKFCWSIVNPGTVFKDHPLIDRVCQQFAAFVHGTCAELTINAQPPGTTKSTIISQIGPVWGWLHYPHHRWGFASHSLNQAIKDNTFRRAIIADPKFQAVFRPSAGPPSWEVALSPVAREHVTVRRSRAWAVLKGADAKGKFVNSATGSMRATSTGAKITGDHFDRLVGDDLLDGKDRAKPETAVDWTFNVFFTRTRDGALKWINGQRLNIRDPSGVGLAKARESGTLGVAGPGGTDFLCFPHHFAPDDSDRTCCASTGVADWRKAKGQLLWPERFTEAWLAAKARDMGPLDFAAQYEQNARVEEVQIFEAGWFKRFEVDPGGGWLEVSIDSSNWSERERADRTAVVLCRIVGGRVYRLRAWADRYTMPQATELIAEIALEYPTIRRWHVEDKAGGRGLIQVMRSGGELRGRKWNIHPQSVKPVNPQKMGGDLAFRADAAAPSVRAGSCYVLAGAEGDAFIRDCAAFPAVWPDDHIAAWVQLLVDEEVSRHVGKPAGLGRMPRVFR